MVRRSAIAVTVIYALISAAIVLMCIGFTILMQNTEKNKVSLTMTIDEAAAAYPLVVIDAGHGGEDGGASDASGSREADINLAVAEILRDYLKLAGIPVLMTREDDRLLYDAFDELEDYTGYKKVYDLRNRLRIAEINPNAIFVSIHMNTFPQSQYSGLQTWYSSNNSASQSFALSVQTHAKTYLDTSNERKIKRADNKLYILSRLEIPAVLVECGFLSNPKEAEMLSQNDYRRLLAVVIGAAVMRFLDEYTSRA